MMPVPQHKEARQGTGGPAAPEDLTGGGRAEASDTEVRITALAALTTSELRSKWQQLYQARPPTRLSRDLLLRAIAYKLQELAHGGLSLSVRRRLRFFSQGFAQRAGAAPRTTLKPGTKLVREWHQHMHTVSVLDDGFEYQGGRYRSLTQIARRITGVAWSGPRFFGIGKRQRDGRGAG
jgi:hypothetical protein